MIESWSIREMLKKENWRMIKRSLLILTLVVTTNSGYAVTSVLVDGTLPVASASEASMLMG